jgi:penicillin-binding protein 1A
MDEHGYTPATLVQDTPLLYLDNMGDFWIPENYSGMYHGPIRLRRALEKSRNVISVKVAEKIGIQGIIDNVAHMIGIYQKDQIKERFPSDLSVSLGSASISPLEMARAFSVFARGGKAMVPYAIRRVEDPQGNVILDPKKQAQKRAHQIKKMGHYQILRPVTATLITSMLKTAVARGTGAGARQYYRKTVAGKTGTTDDFHDAWFVGFNHTLTTAIWFGYDTYGRTLGPGQSGGHVAAPVFGKYYSLAQGHLPNKSFGHHAKVKRIKICAKSGKLPSHQCRHTMMEIFEPGTQPTQVCEVCAGGGFSTKKIEGVDEDLFNPEGGSEGSSDSSGEGIMGDNIFND